MIKIIENLSDLEKYNKIDVFSVRILSLSRAYGTKYDFVTFWIQIKDNEVTSIVSRLDSEFTVSYNDNSDTNELREFVSLIGFRTLMCDNNFHLSCDFESGFVMSMNSNNAVARTTHIAVDSVSLNDVFRLNKDSLVGVDYDSFYADMNHKIRHGVAKTYGVICNNEVVSCAVLVSIYNDNAILSFVATDNKFQRRGFASQTIMSALLCNEFNCFLIIENDKYEMFYNKLGFVNIGKWRTYKR